ncbi:MAG: D-alanine--D-alanine ligase family protein [Deltaproteobacteria bacterium]
MPKLTVAVVFGGVSVEHEISVISARSIIKNLDSAKFEVFPIFIEKSGLWRRAAVGSCLQGGNIEISSGSTLAPSLDARNPAFYEICSGGVSLKHGVDVIFPVLHGTYGEDGTVQGMFELMGVPFVGASVLGSSVGMDKIVMKSAFRQAGLPVADFLGFYGYEWESGRGEIRKKILEYIGEACFVKSANLGSSVGISKVKSASELDRAVDYSLNFSNRIIVERAVANPREIEVSVLGNENPQASAAGEIVPKREFYDYAAKYLEDSTELIIPAKLDSKTDALVRRLAVEAFKAVDCEGFARVDFLMDGQTGDVFISEINTIPGFTQISMYPKLWEASGIKYTDLVSRLIELACERHEAKKRLRTDFQGR